MKIAALMNVGLDRGTRRIARVCWLRLSLLAVLAAPGLADDQGQSRTDPRNWQPIPDSVYLQEIGRKVSSKVPLTSVAAYEGRVYVSSTEGVAELRELELVPAAGVTGPVKRLVAVKGGLFALGADGVWRFGGGKWVNFAKQPIVDLCEVGGGIVAASERQTWHVGESGFDPLIQTNCPLPISRVVSYAETIYTVGGEGLSLLASQRPAIHGGFDSYLVNDVIDWGMLPSRNVRDALAVGSRVYLATDRGLGVLQGMTMSSIRGEQGFCYEDTTCLARGFTNDVWVGTARGAIRMVGNEFQYFAGERWLPDDLVHGVAVNGTTVYIATAKGLGIVEYRPYTMLKKAAYYERHLEMWGQKRLGFTHKLEWDDGLKEFVREVSDNDGGYSGDYLAAEAYRYAVTKDPIARAEAVNTFQALRWLEASTGIRGFPARAIWVKNEKGHKSMSGSGGYPAEWHDCVDARFEWKGDTSSDEIDGHFYAVALFLQLAAQGEEIAQAKTHLSHLAAHLADHNWQLIDLDGQPTRWGRWDPDYFNTDEGRADRGLQSVEILSFIKTASKLTGETRFARDYQKLVDLGYPAYTVRERITFPPSDVVHFDTQLGLWAIWNLLRSEEDPTLRSFYRRTLERTWEIVRIEGLPWFNFVYGALTGNDFEGDVAVAHLREWPLDLIDWSFENSHRADLKTPAGYRVYTGGIRAVSRRETEAMRWDDWTMKLDGGSGGRDVSDPGGWLLAYWMGRYYGFIEAPTTADPRLLGVAPGEVPEGGAKPYVGPQRPGE